MAGTKVLGREKLMRQMAAMPSAVRSEIRQALAQGADQITDNMHRLVPTKTFTLDASIQSNFGNKPTGGGSGVLGGQGSSVVGDPDLTVWITAGSEKAYYARWVEFGTAKVRSQPFFFPAYRAHRRSVRARISRALRRGTRRAISG